MKETFYKPLTPELRSAANAAIDRQIEELKTCQRNGLVNMQIAAREQQKKLINALPDGYPMPCTK